jgi:hypothetical protein
MTKRLMASATLALAAFAFSACSEASKPTPAAETKPAAVASPSATPAVPETKIVRD